MEALLSFALAVLMALPFGFFAREKDGAISQPVDVVMATAEPTAEPTEVPAVTPEAETSAPTEAPAEVPEPDATPEIRRIDEVIEGTVKRVYDGYIILVYRKVDIRVNIVKETEIEGYFTRSSRLRITHSGEILMAEPPEITADRIEALE